MLLIGAPSISVMTQILWLEETMEIYREQKEQLSIDGQEFVGEVLTSDIRDDIEKTHEMANLVKDKVEARLNRQKKMYVHMHLIERKRHQRGLKLRKMQKNSRKRNRNQR